MDIDVYADVLVVGAGPAGLTTSLLLARYGVKDIIVIDKRAQRVQVGQASGLQPRTQEILQTVGCLDDLASGAGAFSDTAFWASTQEESKLRRLSVAPEVTNETFYRRVLVQHQGRTEEVLLKELAKRNTCVLRPFEFLDYDYDATADYPMCAYVKDVGRGQVNKFHCKYVIAADGANSIVRDVAGIKSSVHQGNDTWLVADAEVDTDFPDFRRRSAIRTTHGNIMLIPSPRNTVRIYLLLTREEDLQDLAESRFEGVRSTGHAKTSRVTLLDVMNRRLPSILRPYTLSVKHIFWISKYIIAQRLTSSFSAHDHHLLLVGDSSHSHSPKAAQGMNTGIQDAYNLAWKLALVLRGRGDPEILLKSYQTERTHIARQLIDFDTKFAKLFANQDKIHSPEFHDLWKASQGFTSGLGHQYLPGPLVDPSLAGATIDEDAIEPLQPGKRLLPMHLIRHIDGLELSSLHTMPANGDFHIVIFAGNIDQEPRRSDFHALYHTLNLPETFLSSYNGPFLTDMEPGQGWPPQEVQHNSDHLAGSSKTISLYIVHTANHLKVELRPDFEVWKYNFFEDKGGSEHKRHGVDPEEAMQVAVVRPDHVVGMVRTGDDRLMKDVSAFLVGVGIQPEK